VHVCAGGGGGSLSADGRDVRHVVLVAQLQPVVPLRIQPARRDWSLQIEYTASVWGLDLCVLVGPPGVVDGGVAAFQPFILHHAPLWYASAPLPSS